MKLRSKFTLSAAAAAAMVSATAPAVADSGQHRGRDGIDVGDVIAGALIIGGIAAVASAVSDKDRDYDRNYDRRYERGRYDAYPYGHYNQGYYNQGYDSRAAVEQCVRAAERDAGRYGRARITDVTSINRIRNGYEVRGRLVVARRDHWQRGYDNWDRYGNRYDRYGKDYDKGKFSCVSRFGRIEGLRLAGLRYY